MNMSARHAPMKNRASTGRKSDERHDIQQVTTNRVKTAYLQTN